MWQNSCDGFRFSRPKQLHRNTTVSRSSDPENLELIPADPYPYDKIHFFSEISKTP